ncbi:MAG: ABC transporter substrate-binding protein [Elusimicrobia bacterium]|nr:ABC transporter substrate-binding protein [Elusimicrobiota bacterium]
MNARRLAAVSVLALAPAWPVAATTTLPAKTLDIGVILRLDDRFNGQFNETVSALVDGIEIAKTLFEESNPSTTVRLHRYPHAKSLSSVVDAANRALQDGVPAVVGGELSEEAFVLRDILGPRRVVLVTPTATHPDVTEKHPYAFRACFSDRLVASRLAAFTAGSLKPARVALIHNVSSPYTDFLSRQFLTAFGRRNLRARPPVPIETVEVLRDKTDFDAEIERFKAHGVTHVVMLTHQSDLVRFVLQASRKGFHPVYVGSDGWGSNEHVFEKLVKESPSGGRFVGFRNSYMRDDVDTPMARRFREAHARLHSRSPTAWSAIAFDAAWALLTAMQNASDPRSGKAVQQALKSIKDLELVTSERFSFGPDNSPRKDLYIYRLDKQGVRYEITLR